MNAVILISSDHPNIPSRLAISQNFFCCTFPTFPRSRQRAIFSFRDPVLSFSLMQTQIQIFVIHITLRHPTSLDPLQPRSRNVPWIRNRRVLCCILWDTGSDWYSTLCFTARWDRGWWSWRWEMHVLRWTRGTVVAGRCEGYIRVAIAVV